MTDHALMDPGYLDRVRQLIASDPKVADGVAFDEIAEGDVVRFTGEDQVIVELSRDAGWLVLMDEDDHCTVLRDCKDDRFNKVEGTYF